MRISLEDLSFKAFHGLYPQEKENGNEFLITVHIDFEPVIVYQNDELTKTIDYAEVYQIIASEMADPRGLLEAVVMRMGGKIMNSFELIQVLTLSLSKINPPIGGPCASATVTQTIRRRN